MILAFNRKHLVAADWEPHGAVLETLQAMLSNQPKKRLSAREATLSLSRQAIDGLGAVSFRTGSGPSPSTISFFRSPVTAKSLSQLYNSSLPSAAPSRYRNDFEEVEWLVSQSSLQMLQRC
jgi:hypothetical protein